MVNKLKTSERSRLSYLDFYKGIAILFVIITHYAWTDSLRAKLLFPFWIDMAVPIFMVITGYVNALSYENKNYKGILSLYKPNEILSKWLRLAIPFLPIYILQAVSVTISDCDTVSIQELMLLFLLGGIGPGSYYFPVMLQVVILSPAVWYIVKCHNFKGLAGCFIANVLFEIMKTVFMMSPSIYRLCSLRYLFILSFGFYLYCIKDDKTQCKKKWYYLVGILGACYITVFNYTDMEPIITNQWTVTSVFAVMFIVPVMLHLMRPQTIRCAIVESLGQASWDVFLVQMCYYWAVFGKIYPYISSIPLGLLINTVVCSVVGICYCKVETPITQRALGSIRGCRR